MLSKLIKIMLLLIVVFLVMGIYVHHYVSKPIEHNPLVCYKKKLLAQVGGDGTVYTRVKHFTCEYEKGMLIIEDTRNEGHDKP